MFEHECESDEDCEVYFLKPVNEYNIVEKIREANKELFGDAEADNVCGGVADEQANVCANRKVSFAPDLEDYAPDAGTLEALQLNKEFAETIAEVEEFQHRLNANYDFPAIEEETDVEETAENTAATAPTTTKSDTTEMQQQNVVSAATTIAPNSAKAQNSNDDAVEEICEEITIMDMENEKTPVDAAVARHLVKQRTFDCAEEDLRTDVPDEPEPDNKSLTNLLTSDGEEECCSAATFDIDVDNSDTELNDTDVDTGIQDGDGDDEDDDDEDDDDDLSLIVASYLPDDYDSRRAELTPSGRHSSGQSKSRRLFAPFSKRFSFRRRVQSRNSIGTSCGSATRADKPHAPPPEVTDLRFNYKICCEYRRQMAEPEKLPKYTGYMSEYGLSREQLQRREEKLQRKQRYVLEQALKTNETEMRKMQDNERAFTTWLKNKMRYPINKTRNMFDVKRRNKSGSGGSSGTGSAVRSGSSRVK